MCIQGKESGVALIVTLLLGLIAAGFIGGMMYMLSSGTRVSGIEARYTSALQAAKGRAAHVIDELESFDLRCNDGSNDCWCNELNATSTGQLKCPATSSGYVNSVNVVGLNSTVGDYDVNTDLVSYVRNETAGNYIFTFNITAQSNIGTEERSDIEFVYKIDY